MIFADGFCCRVTVATNSFVVCVIIAVIALRRAWIIICAIDYVVSRLSIDLAKPTVIGGDAGVFDVFTEKAATMNMATIIIIVIIFVSCKSCYIATDGFGICGPIGSARRGGICAIAILSEILECKFFIVVSYGRWHVYGGFGAFVDWFFSAATF